MFSYKPNKKGKNFNEPQLYVLGIWNACPTNQCIWSTYTPKYLNRIENILISTPPTEEYRTLTLYGDEVNG